MPQRKAAKAQFKRFTKGVSYKTGNIGDKLFDAQNVVLIQDNIQTRPGIDKITTEQMAAIPNSISYYGKDDGAIRRVVVKAGAGLYSAPATDTLVFTTLSSSLSTTTKHDAVTINGRHIIAAESDGPYSFDGTTLATLGVTAPSAPSISAVDAGGTLTDKTYTVAITFEASGVGFESNIGTSSAQQATAGGNDSLSITAIPVSTHALVDFKNIYLRNVTDSGNYLYVGQIANATTTYSITTNPAATADTPPTGKDTPLSGGAKYLAIFNGQVVSAGNSTFPSDAFFSNANEPDGWSTDNDIVHAAGSGPITGLAVGLFSNSQLNQYLVAFKKSSFTIYSQPIDNQSNPIQTFVDGVGCVSHKTIVVKDGNIYFVSNYGWRAIADGKLVDATLAEGDIDDIFRVSGFTYGLNKAEMDNAFSVHYAEMDSYMTWVPEGANTALSKCYNYHFDKNAFMPLSIPLCTCACKGENADGEDTIYIAREDRNVYSYDIRNDNSDDIVTTGFRLDVDQLDIDALTEDDLSPIEVFVILSWYPEEDYDSTYNFRSLWMEAISDQSEATSTVSVKAFLNLSRSTSYEYSYNFFLEEGFELDVSQLDVDVLGDDRARVRIDSDINRTGRNILIGVFQTVEGAYLQLLGAQLNYSKNGNANI